MAQQETQQFNTKLLRVRRRAGDSLNEQVLLIPIESMGRTQQQQVVAPPPLQMNQRIPSRFLWTYVSLLATTLISFLLYLILPRGFRKAYCRSSRKRYIRQRQKGLEDDYSSWIDTNSSLDSWSVKDNAAREAEARRVYEERPVVVASRNVTPALPTTNHQNPYHPAVDRVPERSILEDTMSRLQRRGVRLVAHGIQSSSKKVWISLKDDQGGLQLAWQTEFPRQITAASGDVSTVMIKGALHQIPLDNVLYIDVGKRTSALMKTSETVTDFTCFSLLTQNGSLDLQTNSQLERDALVCCLSIMLDKVHTTQDWRAMYQQTPEPSESGSYGVSNISSAAFPTTYLEI